MVLGLPRQLVLFWPIPNLRSLGVELGFESWNKVGEESICDIYLEIDPQKFQNEEVMGFGTNGRPNLQI